MQQISHFGVYIDITQTNQQQSEATTMLVIVTNTGLEIPLSEVESVSAVTQREYGKSPRRIKDYVVYVRTTDGATIDGIISKSYHQAESYKSEARKAVDKYKQDLEVLLERHRVIESRYKDEPNLDRLASANSDYNVDMLKQVRKERLQAEVQ